MLYFLCCWKNNFWTNLEVGFRSEELWITVINRMLTDRKEGYRCGCCSVCRRLYLQYGMWCLPYKRKIRSIFDFWAWLLRHWRYVHFIILRHNGWFIMIGVRWKIRCLPCQKRCGCWQFSPFFWTAVRCCVRRHQILTG